MVITRLSAKDCNYLHSVGMGKQHPNGAKATKRPQASLKIIWNMDSLAKKPVFKNLGS